MLKSSKQKNPAQAGFFYLSILKIKTRKDEVERHRSACPRQKTSMTSCQCHSSSEDDARLDLNFLPVRFS